MAQTSRNIPGWDERDYRLWSRVIQLPSYARIPRGDVAISRTELKELLEKEAKRRHVKRRGCQRCGKSKKAHFGTSFFCYGESNNLDCYEAPK